MNNIYAVQRINCGEVFYCGFFSTAELAEKFIKAHDYTDCRVEKIELDVNKEKLELGLKPYVVRMWKDTSNEVAISKDTDFEEGGELIERGYGVKQLIFKTWTKNKEEAVEQAYTEMLILLSKEEW